MADYVAKQSNQGGGGGTNLGSLIQDQLKKKQDAGDDE
jgi:hypothetical protein